MSTIIICIVVAISTMFVLSMLSTIMDNQISIFENQKIIMNSMLEIKKELVSTIEHVEETLKLSAETSKNVIKFFDELMLEEENK